jgi:hypothetical protein
MVRERSEFRADEDCIVQCEPAGGRDGEPPMIYPRHATSVSIGENTTAVMPMFLFETAESAV